MLIAKGAEAELTKQGDVLIKERIAKGYRLPELDEKLRKRRTITEARLLREARRAGVLTPQIIDVENTTIKMEFIDGEKVKDILNEKNCAAVCGQIGQSIALLHSYDIIHGDLTTSNMIITKGKDNSSGVAENDQLLSLWFIDFGLGFISQRSEDKATDLYLLHEALESTHFELLEKAWALVLEAYKTHYQGNEKVIKALSGVEKRGRYKERPAIQ